jgi:hypothetical protein
MTVGISVADERLEQVNTFLTRTAELSRRAKEHPENLPTYNQYLQIIIDGHSPDRAKVFQEIKDAIEGTLVGPRLLLGYSDCSIIESLWIKHVGEIIKEKGLDIKKILSDLCSSQDYTWSESTHIHFLFRNPLSTDASNFEQRSSLFRRIIVRDFLNAIAQALL